jgi:hypothetical protein
MSLQILDLARAGFRRSGAMAAIGALGVALAAGCALIAAARGSFYIAPEGDLTKPLSFDLALGIYFLTLGLLLDSAGFSERGRRRWVRWTVGLALYSYGIETVQQLRGLDPRFSRFAGNLDALAGLLFLAAALTLIVLGLIMAAAFFRRGRPDLGSPMLLAIRYGFLAAFLGYGSGIWMSTIQGRIAGAAGNVLPLHALGFHGLQAIPLVALLLDLSGTPAVRVRRGVHVAGMAWLLACAATAWQTAAGRPLSELSVPSAAAAAAIVTWALVSAVATALWAARNRVSPGPGSVVPETDSR